MFLNDVFIYFNIHTTYYILQLEKFIYRYNTLQRILCVCVLKESLWNIRIWIHIWIPHALFLCWLSLILRPYYFSFCFWIAWFSLYCFFGREGRGKRRGLNMLGAKLSFSFFVLIVCVCFFFKEVYSWESWPYLVNVPSLRKLFPIISSAVKDASKLSLVMDQPFWKVFVFVLELLFCLLQTLCWLINHVFNFINV